MFRFSLKQKPTPVQQGQTGERLAAQYLQKKGYRVLETNWRSRRGEVDLIVQKKEVLFFVEVKWRRSLSYGTGGDSIDSRKQQKMVAAALDFLQRKKMKGQDIRLGAVVIQGALPRPAIEFFEFVLDLPHQYYL